MDKKIFIFIDSCLQGHLDIVKFLYKQNYGINQIDFSRKNGFIYACALGDIEIVKFLFEKNCGIHHSDN